MAAQLIKGREHADKILTSLKQEIQENSFKPGLTSIVIGGDKLSHFFSNLKGTTAQSIGIRFQKKSFPDQFPPAKIQEYIAEQNANSENHGTVIQLPLPELYERHLLLKAVHPYKDVDCLHPKNLGLLLEGHPPFLPPVVLAVLEAIRSTEQFEERVIPYRDREIRIPELTGRSITLIGAGLLVGKPLLTFLPQLGATVTVTHQFTPSLKEYTAHADIIVTGTDTQDVLQPEDVRDGAVVIAVGNDIVTEKFVNKKIFLTPQRGGIGPLTIAYLLLNTVWSVHTD